MREIVLHPKVYRYIGRERGCVSPGDYIFIKEAERSLEYIDDKQALKHYNPVYSMQFLRWMGKSWSPSPLTIRTAYTEVTAEGVELAVFIPYGAEKLFVRSKKKPKQFYRVNRVLAAGPLTIIGCDMLEKGKWTFYIEVNTANYEFVNFEALSDSQKTMVWIANLSDD